MFHVSESLIALFLAYCYAAAGDLLTGRRANSLWAWNQSFVVGLSLTTALLFPFSLLLRSHALLAIAALLIAAGSWRLCRTLKPSTAGSWLKRRGRFERKDLLTLAMFGVIAALAIQFIAQNALRACARDGYQIWATKSLVLYHRGAMTTDLLVPGGYDRISAYPMMVSLYQALVCLLRGGFVFERTKPVFAFFFVSMLVSTFRAARGLRSTRVALGAVVLLASIPALTTDTNVEGYADMPQACLVAAVAAALLQEENLRRPASFREPLPWLCVGLLLVKNEGITLLSILCVVIGMFWIAGGPASFVRKCRLYWRPIAVVACGGILRLWMIYWVGGHDGTYSSLASAAAWSRAYGRRLEVPTLCLDRLMDFSQWGLLWPAFLLAIPIVLIGGQRREKAAVLAAALAVAAYTSIFCFTNWDVFKHIITAYDRLMSQLAPLVVVVIGMAYMRLQGAPEGMRQSARIGRKRLVAYVVTALVCILAGLWFSYRRQSPGRSSNIRGGIPITGDFDKNGEPDLLWQNDETRAVTVNYYSTAKEPAMLGWAWLNSAGAPGSRLVAAADFDGNGVPDLVWQDDVTGEVTVHYYGGERGSVELGSKVLDQPERAGWTVVAAADFDRNGTPDLLWQNETTRQVTIHYYGGQQGAVPQGWAWLNREGAPGWRVVAAADFDGNGVPDLVWQQDGSRKVTVHYYGGARGAIQQGWKWLDEAGEPGWKVAGANDFDRNGVPDLVFVNISTRQVVVHFYGGPQGAWWQGWAWLNGSGPRGWTPIVPR